MRKISIVMAYYNNPGMLRHQVEYFADLPEDIRQNIEYVVVDDGSVQFPANFNTPALKFDCQLWRMGVDVRWNQDACRNVGAKAARNSWLFLTDIDHIIVEPTLRAVMTEELNERVAYRFHRKNFLTLDDYKFHPNTWLMTKELYDKIGGYDERYAGWYGTDWDFRDRAIQHSKAVIQLKHHVLRVGREHIPDASTPREYGRKNEKDARMIRHIRDNSKGQPPQRGRFPHSLVFKWP